MSILLGLAAIVVTAVAVLAIRMGVEVWRDVRRAKVPTPFGPRRPPSTAALRRARREFPPIERQDTDD